jgi:hypothetical protein
MKVKIRLIFFNVQHGSYMGTVSLGALAQVFRPAPYSAVLYSYLASNFPTKQK